MEMIGEESVVRDRPIYLQFSDHFNFSNSIWYVIEETDTDLTTIEEKDTDLTTIEEEVEEIRRQTDKIRELEVPRIISPSGSLIVFNSRIYILGGYLFEDYGDYMYKCYGKRLNDGDFGDWEGVSKNVFYYDTKIPGKKDWKKGPTFRVYRYDQVVAALENSGIFVAFEPGRGDFEFLEDSLNGIWRTASPTASVPAYSKIKMTRLLAVTDTKVYFHCIGFDGYHHEAMGMSYDVQTSEWNIFDKNFQGWWSPGVVLDYNSNSYLFLFGQKSKWTTEDEECTEECKCQCTVEFCVYDLNNSTWLPSTVEGLPKEAFVEDEIISDKYLLRMNQENKFALVWSKQSRASPDSFDLSTKIHCTKFNIVCTFKSDSQLPIFRAQVVSFESFHVKDNIELWNCAASLIGEDK